MQTFRLMVMGLPDKVICFDELPKEYLAGLEMIDSSKLGKDWRTFIGSVERIVDVKPELDALTRQWRTFPKIKETAPFAYIVNMELNHDKERWSEIVNYVRQNAPVMWEQTMTSGKQKIKMMDDLLKMAKPLAKDSNSELDLEPEDVIVVPLQKVVKEQEGPKVEVVDEEFKCPDCGKSFDKKQGLRLHRTKKHQEPAPVNA